MADLLDLPTIPRAPLRNLAEDERFRDLDRRESYYRATQDASKRYNWDGQLLGYGDAPIKPGWVVPMSQRQPASRYDLAKVIVNRLTSMVFGEGRFPELRCEGDEEAEDYVRELAKEARLPVRMAEARSLGGAEGTACLSFGFVDGKPRVRVHNPKHVIPLRWKDQDEYVLGAVMKAYAYPRGVYNTDTRRMERKWFWTVTFWDEVHEVTWRDIPEAVAQDPRWQEWPKRTVNLHGYGFCPFYWIQNKPDSVEYDGEGDYEGLEGTFDQINQLLSATTKGTRANVDPTLVVKMDPGANTGAVFKGSENALFSSGGAEYLELKGTAVQAAERQLERLRSYCLDVAGVVLADPEKLAGAAQSAKALEILYQPMLANCDIIREQYGEHGVKRILVDMLKVARMFLTSEPVALADGTLVQSKVILAPKVETDPDTGAVTITERTPGTSERVTLNWRPYFAPTWDDIVKATTGMKNANGGKATVSHRTSVQAIAPLVGVEDIDEEMKRIEEEQEADMERQQEAFASQLETESMFGDDDKPPGGDKKDE